jgi:hypothetical protein
MHRVHFSVVSVRISSGILRLAPICYRGIGSKEKRVLVFVTLTLSTHEGEEEALELLVVILG